MELDIQKLKRLGLFFKSGATNQKYKMILDETNTRPVDKEILQVYIIESFKNQEYNTHEVTEDIVLYQV